jgi:nicotinate-nucleotide adenylyltransferase
MASASGGIAIFGGTFDPIHNAHLTMARAAAEACRLARVLFIPAAQPPHKMNDTHASYEDRFRMVEIACAADPRFEASRLEEGAGRSYSILTIERVRAIAGPHVYFLIGADAFAEIRTWHRWEEVVRLVTFIVVSRPGALYEIPPGARVERLEGIELPVSSREIRSRLARSDEKVDLPPGVLEYVRRHRLYQ